MPGPALDTPRIRPAAPRWVFPEPVPAAAVDRLAAALSLPRSVCELLVRRGYDEPDAAKRFLRPRPDQLHPPELLADMDTAVRRLAIAVRAGQTVLVHGDYDVDGVCGTSLLTRALRMMGGRVVPFVPNRMTSGYDLREAGVEAAQQAGASLIVTVDCGIVANAAVAAAGRLGIDVIVSDHHTPGPELPAAVAVINPNRPDCGYPGKGLAGAGVAFKLALAVALEIGFPTERLTSLIDLVAIATVADLMPLTGENRTLVRWGLDVLRRTPNPGLRALLRSSGLDGGDEISAGQVGFVIGPRLNAVGRVADPMAAVRLLLTDDPREAEHLAELHETENRRRRDLERGTLDQAMMQLAERFDPERDRGLVLAAPDWHPGVIGIVASRIVEAVHRPVLLIAVGDREGKGSGRSIPGFHLQSALVECADLLERFGGHAAAAGCSVHPDRIGELGERFDRIARDRIADEHLVPRLRIDAELPLDRADDRLQRLFTHFQPFGMANPTPIFAVRGVRLDGAKIVGERHLKLRLADRDSELEGIAFGMGDRLEEAASGERFDVAFRLEQNEWRTRSGSLRRTLQARVADFRLAE